MTSFGMVPTFKLLRAEVLQIIGIVNMKGMLRQNGWATVLDTLIIHALLLSSLLGICALHNRIGTWTLFCSPLFALITGVAFNWINVQIHEASHFLLWPNRSFNDIYCNVVLGSFALQDVQTYRSTHSMHHSALRTENDPDLWVYATNVGSSQLVWRGFFDDLLLRTIFRRRQQVGAFFKRHGARIPGAPAYTRIAKITAQLLIVAFLLSGCGPWGLVYYGACYIYGLLGVFPALVRIRTVVQHHGAQEKQADAEIFISRTTEASFWQFFLIGARMDYHFEHHLFPNVPYYQLRKIHRVLQSHRLFEILYEQTGKQLRTTNYLQNFAQFST